MALHVRDHRRTQPAPGPLDRALGLHSEVRAGEGARALLMPLNVFLILVAYYVIKTEREPLILNTQVPASSWFASRVDRMRLIVGVSLFLVFAGAVWVPLDAIGFVLVHLGLIAVRLALAAALVSRNRQLSEATPRVMRSLVVGLLLGAVLAAPAAGQPAEQAPARVGDGRRTLSRLPANLARGALGVFHADNARSALVAATASGFGAAIDDPLAEALRDPNHEFGRTLEDAATPGVVGAFVAATFVAGRVAEGPRFRAASYDVFDAWLVTLGHTEALKRAIRRERPNGEDDRSMPSGHTSSAFAVASVVERHYGWKGGVAAYAVASAVAVSRIQHDKHWLSDVMTGGAIGYLVGRTVVRLNGGAANGRIREVQLAPLAGRGRRGFVTRVSF
jgi:membrane-associated phospholipid phosphatase